MTGWIREKTEEYLDSAVILLSELISYKSVMGEPEEGAPFGGECAQVLNFAAHTLSSDGFKVKNFDNYAITAAFDEREPELGILCHLDVVPVDGQDWQSDPFEADIRDGRIYGRGAIDDKGPAVAVITAMRMIKDMGIPLKRNVRLILGSNEENGSADIEYYLTKESFPPMLFTPDGNFPVISAEKGMIRYEYRAKLSDGLISLRGGSVVNAVPERAEAVITGPVPDLSGYEGISFLVENTDNNTVCIKACGKGAHASTPAQGKNALTALIGVLAKAGIGGGVIKQMSQIYPYGEYDGTGAGIACSDAKSGALTSVLSIAESDGEDVRFLTDTRIPLDRRTSELVALMDKNCTQGIQGKAVMTDEPHAADEDSEMVKTLLAVYEDATGEKGECLAIGGGTYVHDTEGGVAFGAEWLGCDNHMHGADEFIGIDELKKDIMIYTEAILRLCC
ncbi:MAG: Sapep family Mn(2+)-dependent dipeptidase [Oscillospiraceae bacterium]|nr:Sapep family Mn(2+)-dependent dipeptidase [Oscillospiraceae bacterium]